MANRNTRPITMSWIDRDNVSANLQQGVVHAATDADKEQKPRKPKTKVANSVNKRATDPNAGATTRKTAAFATTKPKSASRISLPNAIGAISKWYQVGL